MPRRDGLGSRSGVRATRWARRIARQLLPPIVAEPLRRTLLRHRAGEEWQYRPRGWPMDDPQIHGWDAESVAETQLARWPAFVRSVEAVGPLGLSNEAEGPAEGDYATHNTIMSFGYVLGRAAHGRARLSMLDWGGGIGHYCVYARALLPEVERRKIDAAVSPISRWNRSVAHRNPVVPHARAPKQRQRTPSSCVFDAQV